MSALNFIALKVLWRYKQKIDHQNLGTDNPKNQV
jgi:hypothetical protein